MQTKINSALEALSNMVIGFIVTCIIQMFLFPILGINITLYSHAKVSVFLTLASVMRTYFLRRWFTKHTETNITK